MNKGIIYILLFVGIVFTSCVPTKDLIYLQNKGGDTSISDVNQIIQKPYRLQTFDVLSINIKSIDSRLVEIFSVNQNQNQIGQNAESLYFNGYLVDDHGNIRVPILGEINVLGFTVEEVRKNVEEKLLSDYFKKEAFVFVNVKLAGFRYTINGEVGSTGTKVLYQERVSVLEAIANSGDITTTGDRKDVKIIRRFPQGTETYSLDLTDAEAVKSPAFYLQPNDYIYVKPLKQKTWGTGKTGVESIGTIITVLSLATTTYLLLTN